MERSKCEMCAVWFVIWQMRHDVTFLCYWTWGDHLVAGSGGRLKNRTIKHKIKPLPIKLSKCECPNDIWHFASLICHDWWLTHFTAADCEGGKKSNKTSHQLNLNTHFLFLWDEKVALHWNASMFALPWWINDTIVVVKSNSHDTPLSLDMWLEGGGGKINTQNKHQ